MARQPLTDIHRLYERAVQTPEAEVDFVAATYRRLRRRAATRIREDFCGTAAVCCEWVKRSPRNIAIGVDLDDRTLAWGRENNLGRLKPPAQARVRLLCRNVLSSGREGRAVDAVLAMNFSWWVFKTRAELLRYFRSVRASLAKGGVFFLDTYGGWEAFRAQRERRHIGGGRGFTYLWRQERFNPINGGLTCSISFKLRDGRTIQRAFTYDWRLWTIPETREVLADAGFRRTTVYWEGDDNKGGGNGVFTPTEEGEDCPSFIAYITAEK